MNRTFMIGSLLLGIIITCVAAMEPSMKIREFKNLKVLPKDISDQALQKIMEDEFVEGLGVSCKYCHAKLDGSAELDYASDAKPEKEIARSMMRMTLELNNKYFGVQHPMIGDSIMAISCVSCHKGEPYPNKKK
ncbi:MAG: c-type cytochrome [Ferruginibacter sp.]